MDLFCLTHNQFRWSSLHNKTDECQYNNNKGDKRCNQKEKITPCHH